MTKTEKRPALYCRVASGAQVDRFEINAQEQSLITFAKENGYSNPISYLDNAQSGLTLDRPAFSKLTADIEAGKISAVIVRDISRVGRNLIQTAEWFDWLKSKGVAFVSSDGCQSDFAFPAELQKMFAEYVRSQKRKNASGNRKRKELPLSDAVEGV